MFQFDLRILFAWLGKTHQLLNMKSNNIDQIC